MKVRTYAGATAAALLFAAQLCMAPAQAKGVTLIQQRDGSVQTYKDVDIRLAKRTLTLRSADRKGVLTIVDGACSFTGALERCLPYAVNLTQSGKTRSIALSYGTVFLNLSGTEQRLTHSSDRLAPHTALVLLKTARGTYVTVKGTLDEVKL